MPSTQERFDRRGAKLWLWRALVKVCVWVAQTSALGEGVVGSPRALPSLHHLFLLLL